MLVECSEIKKDEKAAEPIREVSRLDVDQHCTAYHLTDVLLKPVGLGPIEVETREVIIKTAQNGSNPAQSELLKFLNDVQNHLKYE